MVESHRAEVAFGAVTHRNDALLGFLVADDQRVRHFVKLRFANLLAQFFAPDIGFGTETAAFEFRRRRLGVLRRAVGEGKHSDLLGGEPHREGAVVLFDEHCERALVAAYGTAVNDERARLFAVLVDVNHIESFGEREVQLHGEQRVFLAVDIGALHIKFGSVESRLAPRFGVGDSEVVEYGLHRAFGTLPVLCASDVLIGVLGVPARETVGDIVLETEYFEHIFDEVDRSREFAFELVGSADDVTVGERELSHACESVHFAAGFLAEKRGGLGVAQGQFAVGFQPVLINGELERTGHGTQAKDFVVDILLADVEHLVLIMIPVSRGDEEVVLGHNGGLGEQITSPLLLVLDETLHDLNYARALGHYEGQALSDVFVGHEQPEFASQSVVVALLGFLDSCEIFVEIGFLLERRAVDAGEHLVLLAAAPVGAREGGEFEALHLARRREMRSRAKVGEIALRVEGNLFAFGYVGKQL